MSKANLSALPTPTDAAALAWQTVLVTGANSGMGFEAAAQLAEAGYGKIVLACRTIEKAERARVQLRERSGKDIFEVIEVDVSSIVSANAAADELIGRGGKFDALLLNAGMVSGPTLRHSADGIEEAFAASIVGHHVLTTRLLDAGLLSQGGRIVIAGSEGANGDLPAMMDMKPYDFAVGEPSEFGANLHDAVLNFAKATGQKDFNPFRHYAGTKLVVAWWAAALERREGERVSVFTVSPGSSMTTNAGRHQTGFKKFMFTKVMPKIAPLMGFSQSVDKGAKRYVDVLLNRGGPFLSGRTYTSRPKKVVGPMQVVELPHLLNEERQEIAWTVLNELTGLGKAQARASA